MCIIAVKKEGVNMPSQETIKRMFDKNSDGAGFMIKRKRSKLVTVEKGFMDLKSFNKAISAQKIKSSDIVVMHFRITTAGETIPSMTHPFVADVNPEVNQVLSAKTDSLCYAHNGTINDYGDHELYSDTSILGMNILSQDFIKNGLYNDAIIDLIECRLDGSRLAVINPVEHKVHIFGEWDKTGSSYKWNEDKESGMIYSNHSWEAPKTYGGYGGYGSWGSGSWGSGSWGMGYKNKSKSKYYSSSFDNSTATGSTFATSKFYANEDNYNMTFTEVKNAIDSDLNAQTFDEEEDILYEFGCLDRIDLFHKIAEGEVTVREYYNKKYSWEKAEYGEAYAETESIINEMDAIDGDTNDYVNPDDGLPF